MGRHGGMGREQIPASFLRNLRHIVAPTTIISITTMVHQCTPRLQLQHLQLPLTGPVHLNFNQSAGLPTAANVFARINPVQDMV